MIFGDRREAGEKLAERLMKYRGANAVILAIPRGGVILGDVTARILNVPLDVIITRKIGAPGNPEFAIGAVSQDGTRYLDESTILSMGVSEQYVEENAAEQMVEIARRTRDYRGTTLYDLKGKIAILVDDGVATGYTAIAAVKYVRKLSPSKVVFAVPVSSRSAASSIKPLVDEFMCLDMPWDFYAVSQFYKRFEQVSDEEVIEIMEKRRAK